MVRIADAIRAKGTTIKGGSGVVLSRKIFRDRTTPDPPLIVVPLARMASAMRTTSHISDNLAPPPQLQPPSYATDPK